MRSLASGLRVVGAITNLSLGGCLMLLGETRGFHRGEALEMTFSVRQLPLRVQGFIRQIHPGYGAGVEFTLITERGKRQLAELIEELGAVLRDQVDDLVNEKKNKENCGGAAKASSLVQRIRR